VLRASQEERRCTTGLSFEPAKGYVGTVPGLARPVTALSLSMLRKRIEAALMAENPEIRLMLDRKARFERDQRRRGGEGTP
jgi:hypothetical protein